MNKPMVRFLNRIAAACLVAVGASASAQSYPTKPIQWIIPFAPEEGSTC